MELVSQAGRPDEVAGCRAREPQRDLTEAEAGDQRRCHQREARRGLDADAPQDGPGRNEAEQGAESGDDQDAEARWKAGEQGKRALRRGEGEFCDGADRGRHDDPGQAGSRQRQTTGAAAHATDESATL